MERKRIIKYLAVFFCLLWVVNVASNKFFWYQAIWWFDMPMHFAGGLAVSLLVSYVFYSFISKGLFSYRKIIFLILATVFIGVMWEVFEYVFNNVIGGVPWDFVDTMSDIFWDTIGSIAGAFFINNW